jgi:hypothetical protein
VEVNLRKRFGLAAVLLLCFVLLVFGVEMLRRQAFTNRAAASGELAAGSIPIYYQGRLIAGFTPADLEGMAQTQFVDAEEGKTQEGWLLRDVLLVFIDPDQLTNSASIVVSSTSRNKRIDMTWQEVKDSENKVMFDLSGRGTLKLVSLLDRLDVRDEWIQDVDLIEVIDP